MAPTPNFKNSINFENSIDEPIWGLLPSDVDGLSFARPTEPLNNMLVERGIVRISYRTFLGAIRVLFRANRAARRNGCKAKFEIITPLDWL